MTVREGTAPIALTGGPARCADGGSSSLGVHPHWFGQGNAKLVNQGSEQIRAGAIERWAVLDYTLEPRGIFECGADVFLEWMMTGTHVGELMGAAPTHLRVEGLLGCSHFTFREDGLIASDLVYFDSATVLRQLGLLPEPEATMPAGSGAPS